MNNNQLATKKDVQNIGLEATDAILEGVDNLVSNLATKDDLKKVETKLENKIDGLSVKVDKLEDTVDGIKADISTAPTREEFTKLKSQQAN